MSEHELLAWVKEQAEWWHGRSGWWLEQGSAENADGAADTAQHYDAIAVCLRDNAEAYGYLSRLFKSVAPQCEPLPTLPGLVTQIDNYIWGLREELTEMAGQLEVELRRSAFLRSHPSLEAFVTTDRSATACDSDWHGADKTKETK